MPVEVEVKLVLDALPPSLDGWEDREEYEQLYAPDGARLRLCRSRGLEARIFCWKGRLPDGRTLEVETEVTPEDAKLFASLAAGMVRKTRLHLGRDGARRAWTVDVFEGGLFMAEAEGEPAWRVGDACHPLLDGMEARVVPAGDRLFTSHALSRPGGMGHALAAARTMPFLRLSGAGAAALRPGQP